MGNHLVEKTYSKGVVKPGHFVFYRGRLRKVQTLRRQGETDVHAVAFADGEIWVPVPGERFEMPEDQEPTQGNIGREKQGPIEEESGE